MPLQRQAKNALSNFHSNAIPDTSEFRFIQQSLPPLMVSQYERDPTLQIKRVT